jgi:large subunit ribosomal protein L30
MRSLDSSKIRVTLMKGYSGRSESQRRTLISLGLKRIGQSRLHANVNPILGQVNKVIQFVRVEPAE